MYSYISTPRHSAACMLLCTLLQSELTGIFRVNLARTLHGRLAWLTLLAFVTLSSGLCELRRRLNLTWELL